MVMNNVVLAIDPGASNTQRSTVIIVATNVDYVKRTYDLLDHFRCLFDERKYISNFLALYAHRIETIILEDFVLFDTHAMHQVGSRFETVKVIERITYDCERLGIADKIVMRMSSAKETAKGMPPEHLAQLIQWQPDAKQRRHYISAYRHLRAYVFDRSIQLKKLVDK